MDVCTASGLQRLDVGPSYIDSVEQLVQDIRQKFPKLAHMESTEGKASFFPIIYGAVA